MLILCLFLWQAVAENSSCLSMNSSDWPAPSCGEPYQETCDGIDNDCNGCTDEGFVKYCWNVSLGDCCPWADSTEYDTCNYNAINSAGNLPCVPPSANRSYWFCNNTGEICGDGIDNNCNNQTDEGCTSTPTTPAPNTPAPTSAPNTPAPTDTPTANPTTSSPTTLTPTHAPSTQAPSTLQPTESPTSTSPTTPQPTSAPTTPQPTSAPTTPQPTASPTTPAPTVAPTTGTPTVSAAPTTAAPTTAVVSEEGRFDVTGTEDYKKLIGGLVGVVAFVVLVAFACMCYAKRQESLKQERIANGQV